jgi:ParB/RepB/Spo0J family partition protein
MNAPLEPAAAAPAALQFMPAEALAPSLTHIQQLRRSRYDVKALDELTESVRRVGIMQPIVARLHPRGEPVYEIVAGERRWIAGQRAELATVPVIVRPLTDADVLELQLTENLQREDLHPLEEAEGYEELMQLKRCRAEDIAAQIGKGRSYVFQRLKLLSLSKPVREAFYAGKVSASIAYDIATIAVPELQAQALKEIVGGTHNEPMSYRDAHDFIVRNYRLALKQAPFDPADATLVSAAGACGACPKRTGNQPELFGDVKSPDVCTDPKCFGAKREAHVARVRAEAKAKGQRVITGKEAKQVFPYDWADRPHGGFVRADHACESDPKGRTFAKILGDDLPPPVLVEHPKDGTLVEVYERKQLTPLLREKGIKRETASGSGASRTRATEGDDGAAKGKREREQQLLVRAFTALHHKLAKAKLGLAELRVITMDMLLCDIEVPDCLDGLFREAYGPEITKYIGREGAKKLVEKLTADQLGVLLFESALARDIGYGDPECTALIREACKRHGVDVDSIRKEIDAEAKTKAAAAEKKPDAKPAPAKASAKPAKAKTPKKRSAKR